VHQITDFESHAKVHNDVIKARKVVVMGSTFEAYNLANAIRSYLNTVGLKSVKVTLFEDDQRELQRTFGTQVAGRIIREMNKQGLKVIRNATMLGMHGDHK
jgi:predicted ATP-grasp superfamily ATP-dependent carboligase